MGGASTSALQRVLRGLKAERRPRGVSIKEGGGGVNHPVDAIIARGQKKDGSREGRRH